MKFNVQMRKFQYMLARWRQFQQYHSMYTLYNVYS